MRRIKKVAVLGAGTMGMGIAAQFANIGCDVLLLDLLKQPEENKDKQKSPNAIADAALLNALKAKSHHPFYDDAFAARIKTGNFEDDLEKIGDCDWIIEAVVEKLEIKRSLFEKIEKHRTPGTLITSNTSGIPISLMAKGRSEDFRKHFCGTHFFNPVRFMRLLEIIPSSETDPQTIAFLMQYGDKVLGKETVLCKDTPGFIANRIGFFSGEEILNLTDKYKLRVEEVDSLTGTLIDRPKTGSFRLRDLIGVDVTPKTAAGMMENLPEDAFAQQQKSRPVPMYLEYLLEHKYLGNKTGQGFYKKSAEKDANGNTIFDVLDLEKLEYRPPQPPELPVLELEKKIRNLDERIRAVVKAGDTGGQFLQEYFAHLFAYAADRIPEISENIYSVDMAMRAGYAWELGPFQLWDTVGFIEGIAMMKNLGLKPAAWINEMADQGKSSFYKSENGRRACYDIHSKEYKVIPGVDAFIILDALRERPPVLKNQECTLHDIGDEVLCLEFTSRNNAIGNEILDGLYEAVKIAEDGNWRGLVIGNNAKNFAVGANLKLMREDIIARNWDKMDERGKKFQRVNLRLRYSKVPVVAAIQGYALGGGCEIPLHCDAVIAAAETAIGLVETGVGLIPGAGGTKEMSLRAAAEFLEGETHLPALSKYFSNIASAKMARSGYNALSLGYLRATQDVVIPNLKRVIGEAKAHLLCLAENYVGPTTQEITVLGRTGLSYLYSVINSHKLGNSMSDYDAYIAKKIAWVMCGGDLTGTQKVSEKYLLKLEREAFMSLAGEKKTLERIDYLLKTGKPLRN